MCPPIHRGSCAPFYPLLAVISRARNNLRFLRGNGSASSRNGAWWAMGCGTRTPQGRAPEMSKCNDPTNCKRPDRTEPEKRGENRRGTTAGRDAPHLFPPDRNHEDGETRHAPPSSGNFSGSAPRRRCQGSGIVSADDDPRGGAAGEKNPARAGSHRCRPRLPAFPR